MGGKKRQRRWTCRPSKCKSGVPKTGERRDLRKTRSSGSAGGLRRFRLRISLAPHPVQEASEAGKIASSRASGSGGAPFAFRSTSVKQVLTAPLGCYGLFRDAPLSPRRPWDPTLRRDELKIGTENRYPIAIYRCWRRGHNTPPAAAPRNLRHSHKNAASNAENGVRRSPAQHIIDAPR